MTVLRANRERLPVAVERSLDASEQRECGALLARKNAHFKDVIGTYGGAVLFALATRAIDDGCNNARRLLARLGRSCLGHGLLRVEPPLASLGPLWRSGPICLPRLACFMKHIGPDRVDIVFRQHVLERRHATIREGS